MRVVILYHPISEHGGLVEDYAKEYKRFKGRELELISLETRQGAELAQLYGITSYPAVLALKPDNQLHELWQGKRLPTMNQLDSYFQD